MTAKARQSNGGTKIFFIALSLAFVIFLPLLIYNKGLFIFLGDYNVQQVPFYKLAHEAVRNGELFWNWNTDLGANFIGSYSFYLLFSPFFWLTLPFPTSFVPYLMAPLIILKTACAALTSYWYIKRFVSNRAFAQIGALLYAFSGFMTFNIFFNHFHEVVVFFPLLLISLEELVQNHRRGFFAAMVAVNCLINYWFFIGEVVFVIIYVIVRIVTGGWGCTFKRFCLIALEAVLGLCIAMIGLLPSILAITGNPRTGTDDLLTGWLMWIYGFNQRLPAIIQSFFFPPELPSRPNFFPEMGAKWASLSAWLPLFSTVGVIAYVQKRKGDFFKRMIIISMIMSLIPILNSAFVLFNGSYYARWFYMPILMLCVATASMLNDRLQMQPQLTSAFRWTAGFIFSFTFAIALSPVRGKEGTITFGLYDNPFGFWAIALTAFVCLLLCRLLLFIFIEHKHFERITFIMLSAVIVSFSMGYIISGKDTPNNDNWYIETALGGRAKLAMPEGDFVRSDFYEAMDNLGMFWGLPNIQAFHSIVPTSIMEFYPAVGIKRDVSSKPPATYDALRSLLSVKWLYIDKNKTEQEPMANFTLYDEQLGHNIYENQRFIPMGFCYDQVFGADAASQLGGEQLVRYMLSALRLEDDAIIRNIDIVEEQYEADFALLTEDSLEQAVADRRASAAQSFVVDKRGFTAKSQLEKDSLMFFSVPFDKGWSATVNDSPVVIEKANIGFMAVRVPKGEANIRFSYTAPGLLTGIKITCLGLGLLIIYLIICQFTDRKKPKPQRVLPTSPLPSTPEARPSLEDYLNSLETLDETDDLIIPQHFKNPEEF